MSERRPMPDAPVGIHRRWDNSELRRRLEGHEIGGVDVLQLRSAVITLEAAVAQLDSPETRR